MIDLRSDLCSIPTEEMWEAMRSAELGWATIGEDASVSALCERAAELLGKADAIWVPTCGMANLVAMLTFCERGDTVVLESASHVLTSEAMGLVEVAGLEPRSLWAADGRLDPDAVDELVRQTRATLLILENTHTRAGGRPLSAELTRGLAAAAKRHDCRIHLDGARLINAAVALDEPLASLAAPVNSVALSLNKSLSAPMGTVLAGSEAVVGRARLVLHRLGGATVHKAGIPAAAGLVALDTMIDRIGDDHRRARELGDGLAAVPGLALAAPVETNIVVVDSEATAREPEELVRRLAAAGVRVLPWGTNGLRLVTHRLIGDAEVEEAIATIARVVTTGTERAVGGPPLG
jgi:threonine aldolase